MKRKRKVIHHFIVCNKTNIENKERKNVLRKQLLLYFI